VECGFCASEQDIKKHAVMDSSASEDPSDMPYSVVSIPLNFNAKGPIKISRIWEYEITYADCIKSAEF
jgi:hypothetical protein